MKCQGLSRHRGAGNLSLYSIACQQGEAVSNFLSNQTESYTINPSQDNKVNTRYILTALCLSICVKLHEPCGHSIINDLFYW